MRLMTGVTMELVVSMLVDIIFSFEEWDRETYPLYFQRSLPKEVLIGDIPKLSYTDELPDPVYISNGQLFGFD